MTAALEVGHVLELLEALQEDLAGLREACAEHHARWAHATTAGEQPTGPCAHGQTEALEVAVARVAAVRAELAGEAELPAEPAGRRQRAALVLGVAILAARDAAALLDGVRDHRLASWARVLGRDAAQLRELLDDAALQGGGRR